MMAPAGIDKMGWIKGMIRTICWQTRFRMGRHVRMASRPSDVMI